MEVAEKSSLYRVRKLLTELDVVGQLGRALKGEEEMTEQQLRIGLALLNKVAPNLSTQTVNSEVTVNVNHREMTRDQIKGRIIELHAERLEKTGTHATQ